MMDTSEAEVIDEMIAELDKWFVDELKSRDAEKILQRTTLQSGIFEDLLIKYVRPGLIIIDSPGLDFDNEYRSGRQADGFTPEQVTNEIVPCLRKAMQDRIEKWSASPLIAYHFTLYGKFPTTQGIQQYMIIEHMHEEKKKHLQRNVEAYIEKKLTGGSYPTKPLETFFLTRHLLDQSLFTELNSERIITLYDRIQELNQTRPEALAEHRRNMIQSLERWADEQFVPRYFDRERKGYGSYNYTLRDDAKPADSAIDQTDPHVHLFIYAAIMILRYEPSYSKPQGLAFLEQAVQLGSQRAAQVMKEGSGRFTTEELNLVHEEVECKANDVFLTVTVVIREESEKAYRSALEYIIRLLDRGFPKGYKIKLKSKTKMYLPIKGLAKSDTHRFFGNALVYPELHPLLEQYARTAMEEYEWYEDTEEEKSVMPGSYAVFGLGLLSEQYFSLVKDYMELVDDEHQLVQDGFIKVFAEKYGLTSNSAAALIAGLRRSTDRLKLKLQDQLEEEEVLSLIIQEVKGLPPYEVERILYPLFGKLNKISTMARKAEGKRKELLFELLDAAGQSKNTK